MSSHLGADLAALVDGELDHPSRERVLRHLTRCQDCRAEVTAQRCFKSSLRALAGSAPAPADDLSARLRAVAARPDGELLDLRPAARRPSAAPRTPRSPRGPQSRRRLPRTAVGGAVLAFGLGAVLALGGQHREPVRAPVDPRSDAFLVDFSGTGELPLPEPTGVTAAGLGR